MLSLLQSADDVIDLALAGAASERYLLASKECQEARTHRLVAQNQLLHSLDLDPRKEDASEIATYGSAAVMKGLAPPLSLAMKRIGAIRRKPYERVERM